MEYRIVKMPSGHSIVYDANDNPYGNYDAEHKAKRRIRDLKAKEINAGVHGNLKVPDPAVATDGDYEAYAKAKKITTPIRRVGCYPAIPKSAYRKDWR